MSISFVMNSKLTLASHLSDGIKAAHVWFLMHPSMPSTRLQKSTNTPSTKPVSEAPPHADVLDQPTTSLANEANERLLQIQGEAAMRHCSFLWDDDEVSIGFGEHTQVWTTDNLPHIGDIDWSTNSQIPVAMITGTNGKTTTSRMLTRI